MTKTGPNDTVRRAMGTDLLRRSRFTGASGNNQPISADALTVTDTATGLNSYNPQGLLCNPQIQTVLASSRVRAWGQNQMASTSKRVEIEVSDGIRLLGALSTHSHPPAKGMVIMLHGWEGSIDSTYMLCTGRSLFDNGYDIFRLNFRDHGQSQHLNQGLFYAVLLDEIFEAVMQVAARVENRPVFLVGFSLGGNFVLRIMKTYGAEAAEYFRHAVAISPVLNPRESTRMVDDHPFIRRYFLRKWKRSLQIKAGLYPENYDFRGILELKSIGAMTASLLERYSDYDASSYFEAYSVGGQDLLANPLPATLIVAADDPIIPRSDFQKLKLNAGTHLVIHDHGGHNGFLSGWPLKSWYEKAMLKIFDNIYEEAR